MKQALLKKIAGYSALAAIAVAFTEKADAQVVYTDIPDFTSSDDDYPLDLNNDGIIDFIIAPDINFGYWESASGRTFYSTNLSVFILENPVSKVALDGFKHVGFLQAGYIIHSHLPFNTTPKNVLVENDHNDGQWPVETEGFAGLRITRGGHNYYGWVRLKVITSDDLLTVMDYAINLTPEAPLLSGEGSEVLADVTAMAGPADLQYTVEQNQLRLVNIPPVYEGGELIVTDLSGKIIAHEPVTLSRHTINLSSSALGVYLFRLTKEGKSISRKIVLN